MRAIRIIMPAEVIPCSISGGLYTPHHHGQGFGYSSYFPATWGVMKICSNITNGIHVQLKSTTSLLPSVPSQRSDPTLSFLCVSSSLKIKYWHNSQVNGNTIPRALALLHEH